MRWLDERDRLGLTDHPQAADPNPHIAHRATTERQLRLIQRIWPAKDWSGLMANMRDARAVVQDKRLALTL